jgi:hypothetical protein
MTEIELVRTDGDRNLYALADLGTLRLAGGRSAEAEAGGERWDIARRGFWRRRIVATDGGGTPVGEFAPETLRSGGRLVWDGRELSVRPVAGAGYALVEGGHELALLADQGWGPQPISMSIHDAGVDPGLLLFAAFVVRGLADDATFGAFAARQGTYTSGSYV